MTRSHFYNLGPGHIPIPVTPDQWKEPGRDGSHIVAKTTVAAGVMISTVFLGVDHGISDDGPPVLYETMVIDDYAEARHQWRWHTWEEAAQGHNAICELLTARLAPKE